MNIKILVFTVDGEVFASKSQRATHEELDSIVQYLERIKTMTYFSIRISVNTEMYFNPDKIIGVQIQKQEV